MAVALTAFKTIAPIAAGMSQRASAMNDAARMEGEAALAETQALQRDTLAREELQRFTGSIRAARAANGLSATSPNALVLQQAAMAESDRDRLIARADSRQQGANFRAAARGLRRSGNLSLVTGVASGGVSLAEYGFSSGMMG
jgi:hypothetical protein